VFEGNRVPVELKVLDLAYPFTYVQLSTLRRAAGALSYLRFTRFLRRLCGSGLRSSVGRLTLSPLECLGGSQPSTRPALKLMLTG